MLLGPYSINLAGSMVTLSSPGVYLLSRDGSTVAYIGRSDMDIASRIRQSANEGYGYTYFWFEYTPSPREAYLKECEYYHRYNPPDNSNHPAVPFATNWRCPMIGCPFS